MKRKANFLLRNIGGENLLVPLGSQVLDLNGIVTLNATGSYLWELMEKDCSIDGLAAIIAEIFDVDRERARMDIQIFLEKIASIGLLE